MSRDWDKWNKEGNHRSMLSFFAFQSTSVAVASCMHTCDHSSVSQFLSSPHLSKSQVVAMSSEGIFDPTSLFCALFMKLPFKKKDAAAVQRTITRADPDAQMFFEDVVQWYRLGDQPSATKRCDDRNHLCKVMKIIIELEDVCDQIAASECWNAEEYEKMIGSEEYKKNTNRGLVYFRIANSRRYVHRDLGNWMYVYLYYCIHLRRPEFVKRLSKLKESLQVDRFPAVTEAEKIHKGDVIEWCIYKIGFTGSAIPKELRDRNNEMMQKFRHFSNLMHTLEMQLARSPILTRTADEWCNSQRPQPEPFALAIHLCKKAYVEPNDLNLREAHGAVQALCTTSTPLEATDPWDSMLSVLRQRLGWQQLQELDSGRTWWYHPEKQQWRTSNADSDRLRPVIGFVQ